MEQHTGGAMEDLAQTLVSLGKKQESVTSKDGNLLQVHQVFLTFVVLSKKKEPQ